MKMLRRLTHFRARLWLAYRVFRGRPTIAFTDLRSVESEPPNSPEIKIAPGTVVYGSSFIGVGFVFDMPPDALTPPSLHAA
jgi:hypothetical protein